MDIQDHPFRKRSTLVTLDNCRQAKVLCGVVVELYDVIANEDLLINPWSCLQHLRVSGVWLTLGKMIEAEEFPAHESIRVPRSVLAKAAAPLREKYIGSIGSVHAWANKLPADKRSSVLKEELDLLYQNDGAGIDVALALHNYLTTRNQPKHPV